MKEFLPEANLINGDQYFQTLKYKNIGLLYYINWNSSTWPYGVNANRTESKIDQKLVHISMKLSSYKQYSIL